MSISSSSPAAASIPTEYPVGTSPDVVLATELGQLARESSLTTDQKLQKLERAQKLITRLDKHIPMPNMHKAIEELRVRIRKGEEISPDDKTIVRCKLIAKRCVRIVKRLPPHHPARAEIPERFRPLCK